MADLRPPAAACLQSINLTLGEYGASVVDLIIDSCREYARTNAIAQPNAASSPDRARGQHQRPQAALIPSASLQPSSAIGARSSASSRGRKGGRGGGAPGGGGRPVHNDESLPAPTRCFDVPELTLKLKRSATPATGSLRFSERADYARAWAITFDAAARSLGLHDLADPVWGPYGDAPPQKVNLYHGSRMRHLRSGGSLRRDGIRLNLGRINELSRRGAFMSATYCRRRTNALYGHTPEQTGGQHRRHRLPRGYGHPHRQDVPARIIHAFRGEAVLGRRDC
jgi:hypothetical protein